MKDVKVYEICDRDYVVTKLSKKDTKEWYEKEYCIEIDLDEIRECDLDSEKMGWELTDGEWEEITFKEAINRETEYKAFITPFVIASTEY